MENQESLCKASEIAKIVINKCLEKGYTMDIIKLQQLLTLIQGDMLAKYNITFFPQDIYFLETPTIKEILNDISEKKINLEKNKKSNYVLSIEENYVIDEIIKRFGIYNSNTLKTSFIFNILDKIYLKKEDIIPIEYLKILFLELGFNIKDENKTLEVSSKERYSNLTSNDFPRKWLPNPETKYVPTKHDLGKLADTISENGFLENYCLDEDEVKQIKLIRYYRKNYN